MKRFLRWLREPEVIGAPDCPIILRWTIIDSKPATVSPSSNPDAAGDDGDSFFRHKIVALFELPKWLTRDRKLMIHRFCPNVEDRDPHDHPRGFWTFVLWGGYLDLVPCPKCDGSGEDEIRFNDQLVHSGRCLRCESGLVIGDRMRAGVARYRPAQHRHITQTGLRGAWTIVVMGPLERGWGFWKLGRFWPWKDYEKEFGFAMRCPTDEEREDRLMKYADGGEVVYKAAPVGLSSRPDLSDTTARLHVEGDPEFEAEMERTYAEEEGG